MVDEITKQLLKGDNITLNVKVDGGRLRISASSLENQQLSLRPDEYLEINMVDGSVVVWRRPLIVTAEEPPTNALGVD
jgi:hypothetical protein